MADNGTVSIHGKIYKTVALRITEFRAAHPGYAVKTKVLSAAELVQVKATIMDDTGRIVSTGLAEEVRGSTNINKTSALENAETSAVGRALAFFGLGGTEIASADEVANAINQQAEKDAFDRAAKCSAAVRAHWDSVGAIQTALANGDWATAKEAWGELPRDDHEALWLATTKGGILTTKEREQMQTTEWKEA